MPSEPGVCDGSGGRGDAGRRVVIVGNEGQRPAIDRVVPGRPQVLDDLGLDLEAGMIAAEINTHGQIVPHTCHDGGVSAGLGVPVVADIATRWTVAPVALAVAAIAAGWYVGSVRRLQRSGGRAGWPLRRSVTFALGIALLVWTTCGFTQVYSRALFWVWTSQQLVLLLIVPILLMAGQPIELARRTRGERALPVRLVQSRVGGFFANPLVGPVLIPALSFVLFFGPLPGWAIEYPVFGGILR